MDEEQAMEIEALEAIFLDDLQVESNTPPRKLKIKITAQGQEEDEDQSRILQADFITIHFEFFNFSPDYLPQRLCYWKRNSQKNILQ